MSSTDRTDPGAVTTSTPDGFPRMKEFQHIVITAGSVFIFGCILMLIYVIWLICIHEEGKKTITHVSEVTDTSGFSRSKSNATAENCMYIDHANQNTAELCRIQPLRSEYAPISIRVDENPNNLFIAQPDDQLSSGMDTPPPPLPPPPPVFDDWRLSAEMTV